MRRRRRFWARTTQVFRCMTERDVSMGLHRRFIKAAWSTAVEILRKVKRTWGGVARPLWSQEALRRSGQYRTLSRRPGRRTRLTGQRGERRRVFQAVGK